MIQVVTRRALYECVWADPLSGLALESKTNGPWLKNLCVELRFLCRPRERGARVGNAPGALGAIRCKSCRISSAG
jgi:hypothetical protein